MAVAAAGRSGAVGTTAEAVPEPATKSAATAIVVTVQRWSFLCTDMVLRSASFALPRWHAGRETATGAGCRTVAYGRGRRAGGVGLVATAGGLCAPAGDAPSGSHPEHVDHAGGAAAGGIRDADGRAGRPMAAEATAP
ncbi:hypothetical protein GCM10022284_70720 [Streptomyces hundungensis]